MSQPIKIAIASGKGGTGKTTIATNLATSLAASGFQVTYADCDVEEPNGHIFLKPEMSKSEKISKPVPNVNEMRCKLCGLCSEICAFSAIIPVKNKVLVFENLCHSCGGCSLVCPRGAISETGHFIGVIESGRSNGVGFIHGKLDIGRIATPPLIKEIKLRIPENQIAILDLPPGTSCPVIEGVKGCDHVLLVTEPTPFGLNDLKLTVEMARELKLDFSVLINRFDIGDGETVEYCKNQKISIMMEIPDDTEIAKSYSRGVMFSQINPEFAKSMVSLFEKIRKRIEN